MSNELTVYTALQNHAGLTALVGNRVYGNRAPDSPTRPYVTYFSASIVPQNDLSSTPLVDNNRVQVDCWAESSYNDAKQIAAQCRAALQNVGLCVFARDDYEQDTKLHRVQLDFSIFG